MLDTFEKELPLPGVKDETALAYIVQKEAIQNAVDARDPRSPDKFSVVFELYEGNRNVVTIADQGTYGLTGRAVLRAMELDEMEFEEYKNERWARFEAMNYANPDPRAIGSRGMGKFFFIGSSKDREIIYDTLRADGIYRVGHWVTRGRGGETLLVGPPEGKEGEKYLKEKIPNMHPLKRVGTRIAVVNPEESLESAFFPLNPEFGRMSNLYEYISETWWELLVEGGEISIRISRWPEESIEVRPPKIFCKFQKNPNLQTLEIS
jgi:hypothetical protein